MIPDLRPFLEEDVGAGDITASVFLPETDGRAVIICESRSSVAGLEEAAGIFSLVGVHAHQYVQDGDVLDAGTTVMEINGPLRGLMTAERTALNFLMRMSGIADLTRRTVESIKGCSPPAFIAATRKTTPGFRFFEKKAVSLGGGITHRNGLYDMVMVKDNHLRACGGIENAVHLFKNVPEGIKIEVEVENMDQGIVAAKGGADVIMADHMSPADTKKMRDVLKKIRPNVLIEASGNITHDTAVRFAGCADIISLGELTHSVRATHFSMDIVSL